MKQRFFGFLAKHKKLSAALMSISMLMTMGVLSFAAEGDPVTLDVSAMMATAAQSIVNDAMNTISTVTPVLVPLLAAGIIVFFGFKFIKKVTAKAS